MTSADNKTLREPRPAHASGPTGDTVKAAANPSSQRQRTSGVTSLLVAATIATSSLVACAPTVTKHGNILSQSDLQQVQPGASKEQVQTALGTPATTSSVDGGAYYYISSTREQNAFFKPKVVDRRVVAVYFDQFGTVEKVARFGLKDGKVFDFISRETPTHARDLGIIQKLFRGIGTPGLPPGAQTPGSRVPQ